MAAVTGAAALVAPASALAAHNVIEPISVASDGAIGNGSSVVGDHLGDYGDMTPDGRFVAFASAASNLVSGDTDGVGDVFVRDRLTGVTERVSVGPKGVQGNGDSNFLGISTAPAISDDGRYVAFKSDASNLVKGDRNGLTDVFVRDRAAGVTERVSGDGGGDSPDGNFVAFETFDFDGDFAQDIYLRDRATGAIERVSVSHDGSEVFGTSEDPVVANGPVVAFASDAPNLVPGDGQRNIDVFVRDLSGPTPTTERISVSSDERESPTPAEIPRSRPTAATSPSNPTPETSPRSLRRSCSRTCSSVTARPARPCSRARTAPAARPRGRARTRRSAPTAASSRSPRSRRI